MRILVFLFISCFVFAKSPELLLLKKYSDQNISGWLMSEKLDGVRGFWDGKHLLSRKGKILHVPKWFIKDFPPFELDGELWSKREDFEFIQSVVMDKKPSKGWKKITYNIFEVPNQKGGLKKRLKVLKTYLKTHKNTSLRVIKQIRCEDKNHLSSFFKSIREKGGEGVVVRDAKAPYISKRTSKALKVKEFDDAECEVVGYKSGKGKYKNLLGSLVCKLPNGVTFNLGSGFSDIKRKNPPKIGQIVTFKYQGYTKYKKPRFPVFLRVRY